MRIKSSEYPCHLVKEVLLNDELISRCMELDTKAGFVVVYKQDANGNPVRDEEKFQTEKRFGVVTVKFKTPPDERLFDAQI